ncbi:MAG: T9SS type A sorting domain-containing protein [Bacteroidales bacterium]|nr:T9SS type A sorting domain-containing protein [Bacteroidales bacterium]MBN2817543.1 T9SS type A sorting domain-containing protein [Bacteroidales bacterium]
MKFLRLVLVLCLCYGWLYKISGQVHENAVPYSVTENLSALNCFEEMPSIDSTFCLHKPETAQSNTKNFQFACPFHTEFDPDNSGEWTETSSGRIWRLGIHSENAYSIYLTLKYKLLPGVRLYVYGPKYEDLRGAFTSKNNNSAGILSIAPVRGSRVIIEINIPTSQKTPGEAVITQVYHDYINIFPSNTLKSTDERACFEDINCLNGKYWQTEKRSVCKVLTAGGMGTGTLVGNTAINNTPYVLTAGHLITSAEMAAEALFIFNYESTACMGEPVNTIQSLSGATLIANTNNQVDFALMKLNEPPPSYFIPFYAGWDAGNLISPSGVCIHHPFGEVKQIAVEFHPVKNENIGKGFDANSTWKVSHWEIGSTELGSSGAPLFNEQHRIFATMSGGRSTCSYPYDDYFTKFSTSWDSYSDPAKQLKYWLDSAQTNQLVLDGYDPYGFNTEFCDTAWNIFPCDKIGLSQEGLEWGWISGHSSEGFSQFAEKFESPGGLQIAGIYLNVAKAYSSEPLSSIEIKVWAGAEYPEKECYSELLFIKDIIPEKVNYIPFDSVIKTADSFFAGYKINYKSDADTFALFHAMDRGYNKPSSMYLYDDTWYQAENQNALQINTSLCIGISECYGKSQTIPTKIINIYPNPASNSLTLDIPGGMVINDIKCYDINAQLVNISLEQSVEKNKLYFNLSSGIYFLKIVTSENTFSAKFIVLN